MRLRFQPLDDHDRTAFSCEEESVDRFLKTIAKQRQDRKMGQTFVAINADGDPRRIIGFYTLLPHEFRGEQLPDPYRKGTRVGNQNAIPGALLAQLGVSKEFQRQGISKTLVWHALQRAAIVAEQWGCVAVVTDPLNDIARTLYRGFGFVPLNDGTVRMLVTITTINAAAAAAATRKNAGENPALQLWP